MRDENGGFLFRELEHEVFRKVVSVPFDLLPKMDRLHFVKPCEVTVEHDALPANEVDLPLDVFEGEQGTHILGAAKAGVAEHEWSGRDAERKVQGRALENALGADERDTLTSELEALNQEAAVEDVSVKLLFLAEEFEGDEADLPVGFDLPIAVCPQSPPVGVNPITRRFSRGGSISRRMASKTFRISWACSPSTASWPDRRRSAASSLLANSL